jgi:2',3'-cyclic-nucleotide 2'-phosphodiesterase (5'-nucleotidase family)
MHAIRRLLTLTLLLCVVTAGVGPAMALPATAAAANDTATAQPETPTNDSTGDGTTLTVLTYNDIQTAAAEDGNFPRLVTLIEERRAALDNPVVVVGAGDQIGPHALSPVSQWRAPVDVLNLVGPDADVIGNHEFDYGLEEIPNVTNASRFPWLATNLVNSTTGESFDGTEEYRIVERGGVRVGVIGLVDRGATYGKTNIDFAAEGITLQNYTTDGAETADYLREEEDADVVVALAHTGVPDAKRLAEADDGDIDVIAVGDDEIYYPPNETSDSVIVEGVARARYLSEINLTVEDGEVTAWNGRLINVSESGAERNETASQLINEYRAEVSLDSTVAVSEVALDARFATNYHEESNYGNLVTDAMRNATGADVAITNAGGIRSDSVYGPGDVTGGDVFNTLPFPNALVTVELNGSELRRVLASQVVTLESETGQEFGEEISQQVSGVSFEWVPHESVPPAERVRDVSVGGEPVEANRTYTVTVNSFMADGGSGYPLANATRVNETDTLLAEAVIDYMQAKETVAPTVEGRMQRVDTALDAQTVVGDRGPVVLAYRAPEDLTAVADASTYTLVGGDGRVTAEAVGVTRGFLVVQFDREAVADATGGAGVASFDLYGEYESSAYEFTYFENARLNSDVTVVDPSALAGTEPGGESDASEENEGAENEEDDEEETESEE